MNPFFELPNKNPVTCHVFCVDCVPSNAYYSVNPFAQKVRNLCWMLKSVGHRVVYYGYESCDVECDEKVIVASEDIMNEAHPHLDTELGHFDIHKGPENPKGAEFLTKMWTLNTRYELGKRYQSGDFFFWMLPGCGQRALYCDTADWDVFHIEASVGYVGAFLPYRVFESTTIKNYHAGIYHSNVYHYGNFSDDIKGHIDSVRHYYHVHPGEEMRRDIVIPGYIDKSLFDFKIEKDDYFLYLARVLVGKGIVQAVDISREMGVKLVVAGPGDFEKELDGRAIGDVEVLGAVGPEKRRELLSNARAVFCLTYPSLTQSTETFGCAAVEGMLSGTVPIACDDGGFLDTIKNGYNGYRIDFNNIDDGVNVAKKLDQIDPYDLRYAGLYYSRERVALMYDAYIQYVYNSVKGIKTPRPSVYRSWESEKIDYPDDWMIPVDVSRKEKK